MFVMEMGDQILYCKQVGSDLIPVARNTLQDNSDVHNKRFEVQCPENEGGIVGETVFSGDHLGSMCGEVVPLSYFGSGITKGEGIQNENELPDCPEDWSTKCALGSVGICKQPGQIIGGRFYAHNQAMAKHVRILTRNNTAGSQQPQQELLQQPLLLYTKILMIAI